MKCKYLTVFIKSILIILIFIEKSKKESKYQREEIHEIAIQWSMKFYMLELEAFQTLKHI